MNTMQWRANWIWDGGGSAPVNAYRYFLKQFTLPEDCPKESMVARISADNRYILYVNGSRATHGPAPSTRLSQTFDVIDLSVYLKFGEENTVVAIVNFIGEPTFAYVQNRAGFLFEMGGIISDATWLVSKQTPWQPDSQRITVQQGHCEHFDARLEPLGVRTDAWSDSIIDLTEWTAATVIAPAESGPWPKLEARDIPLLDISEIIEDIALIEYGNCTPVEGDSVAAQMTEEAVRPLRNGAVRRAPKNQSSIAIQRSGEDIYLIFDFGKEVSGFLELDVYGGEGVAGGTVDIGYDEGLHVGETASGLQHSWPNSSHLRYADRLILRDGSQRFTNYSHRAFRYVRLAFRGYTGEVILENISLLESTYPVNRRGSFTCSDARLNTIWEIGRRTLQLCMDDKFMDCPWRERAQWVGDARVEAYGAQYCFGDTLLLRRMLRQISETQHPDGRTDPVGPGDWDKFSPNQPIPGFIAIWIHAIADYYLLTGDTTVSEQLMPAVERAIGWFESFANADGLLENIVGWNFIDWAAGMSGGNTGVRAPINLLYLQAVRVTANLAGSFGDAATQAKYADRAASLVAQIHAMFWDEQRGLFKDFVETESGQEAPENNYSQQTNSLALLYEIGTDEQRRRILQSFTTDESLTQIASPYFGYYLLAALYKYGEHDQALAYIRKYWGMMLDAGATTWWEEYHGKTSRCHAWSCGPTIDLQAQFLGVTPDEPGFTTVRIAPHFGDMKWAKGIVPIPQGEIVVNWVKTDDKGGFVLNVTSPKDVSLKPVLPEIPAGAVVTVNDELTGIDIGTLPGGGYRIEVKIP